jgi:hypothetical protein
MPSQKEPVDPIRALPKLLELLDKVESKHLDFGVSAGPGFHLDCLTPAAEAEKGAIFPIRGCSETTQTVYWHIAEGH